MRRLVMKMSRSKEGDPDFDQEASFLTIFFSVGSPIFFIHLGDACSQATSN